MAAVPDSARGSTRHTTPRHVLEHPKSVFDGSLVKLHRERLVNLQNINIVSERF